MRKVLIANRAEIAVRVVRACRDAGLTSAAVYAEPDLDALHVRLADEAHALGGQTPAESYLNAEKVLRAAKDSGADAVHPGYGFLAESADFAEAVTAAGLTWVGPPAAVIRELGDKILARHLAERTGAPLTAGTREPVSGPGEAEQFARSHGLPVAVKAARGGGGRGLKVARTLDELPVCYDSAVREATAAFGDGACYVEHYLDRPRHVETQVLADAHGHVVVVSTRDCSLQRRHQKLVEEAPAPQLTGEQQRALYTTSKAIMAEAGYVGAGTCEFLVGEDGTISFLEVNTRLQVEHPVTEEISGIDLVREQLRIADGEPLEYDDPPLRGHAIEFRINGEDPGRGFLPTAGTVTGWHPPAGPGVRLDSGVEAGSAVTAAFDSLLAKLIVTGDDRPQALARARRALAEFQVTGLASVIPFHRVVLQEPAFASEPFAVHTRWIETEFENTIAPHEGGTQPEQPPARERVTVEVGGKRLEVVLPAELAAPSGTQPAADRPPKRRGATSGPAPGGNALVSPMQGTIVTVPVTDGQRVSAGDTVVVLEAMKMEQPLTAHKSGTVRELTAEAGQTISHGAVVCEIAG